MGIIKSFFFVLFAILGIAISAILTWGILYLTIPSIRDWTDKNIFVVTEDPGPDCVVPVGSINGCDKNFTYDYNANIIIVED